MSPAVAVVARSYSAAVVVGAVSMRSSVSTRRSTSATPAYPTSPFSFRCTSSRHIVRDSSNRRQLVLCRAGQSSESPTTRAAATAAAGVSVAAVALLAAHTGLAHATELGDAASEAVLEAAAIAPGELKDETFADFNVEFAGRVWDHKTIVYALVFGQWVGFIGALVGGNSARQRKEEVEQLNQKLLQVNQQLRAAARKSQRDLKVKEAPAAETKKTADWLVELRKGKSLLKDRNGAQSQAAFERALVLLRSAEGLQSPWKAERKALRGLSAAHRLMGEKKVALEYILKVIDLCDQHGDRSAKGDALGVVADLYTDIGDFDKAAEYYDLYLAEIGDAMGSIDVDPSNTQVSV